MEVLTLNGKKYVKASKAAKDLGYASDYVGQLCRSGSVEAHLVGRTWYVNPDTLGAHRVEKKRVARTKAREYAKKSIEEARSRVVKQNTKSYKTIDIHYKDDGSELIPSIKKLHVVTENHVVPHGDTEDGDAYLVMNKNKKVVMSGTVPVFDADEETVLTDTVTLVPTINRTTHVKLSQTVAKAASLGSIPSKNPAEPTQTTPQSFEAKLLERSTEVLPETTIATTMGHDEKLKVLSPSRFSRSPKIIILISLVTTVLSVVSIFIEERSITTSSEMNRSYTFEYNNVLDFILKNIDISSRQ